MVAQKLTDGGKGGGKRGGGERERGLMFDTFRPKEPNFLSRYFFAILLKVLYSFIT